MKLPAVCVSILPEGVCHERTISAIHRRWYFSQPCRPVQGGPVAFATAVLAFDDRWRRRGFHDSLMDYGATGASVQ